MAPPKVGHDPLRRVPLLHLHVQDDERVLDAAVERLPEGGTLVVLLLMPVDVHNLV